MASPIPSTDVATQADFVLPLAPPSERLTSNAVRGRVMGCFFFIGFGAIWTFNGLAGTRFASPGGYAALAFVVITLVCAAVVLQRRAQFLPAANPNADHEERTRRMFLAVNIIQWVSIITASVILGILRIPQYTISAIAIIVGLHLFPLAGSFRYRPHYVTGALLLLWSLGALAILPADRISAPTSLGTGFILLGSVVSTLASHLARTAQAKQL